MKLKCVEHLLDWIYPRRANCLGCGSAAGIDEDWLCADCAQTLAKHWIGAKMEADFEAAVFAYYYAGVAGNIVRSLKYRGATILADWMAERMVRAYRRIEPTGVDIVTFVPMHKRRQRRRGFNHAESLGRCLATRLNLPLETLLVRVRNTPQQTKLDGGARKNNLKNAFSTLGDIQGRRILLVDDVFTTGTTARECAKELRKAGATAVYVATFAKGGTGQ